LRVHKEGNRVTFVVWIAIALAAVVFVIFAGWPLYNTYKTRGQGADVAEAQAYFKAKAEAEHARSAAAADRQLRADSSDTGQRAESDPLTPPSRDQP
jgi:hypothetical protein